MNRRCGLIIAAGSRLQLERLGRVKAESILAPADEDLLPAFLAGLAEELMEIIAKKKKEAVGKQA